MRIWSLHPKYLDRQGLLAVWREALLAQKVLKGETKGYRHHPQLIRFHRCPDPVAAIATYLVFIADDADTRGYNFDRSKIDSRRMAGKIAVTMDKSTLSGNIKNQITPARSAMVRTSHQNDDNGFTSFIQTGLRRD